MQDDRGYIVPINTLCDRSHARPVLWFELPEGEFIHSGNSTARIGWNRRGHRFAVRDGIPLGYGSRPAVLRLNVVLYYVGITVGGMTTRSLLGHRLAGSAELGSRITVDAVISGEGTPVFLKRITVRAGDDPEMPLTRTWTEGEIEDDHIDRHLSIEEDGRGGSSS